MLFRMSAREGVFSGAWPHGLGNALPNSWACLECLHAGWLPICSSHPTLESLRQPALCPPDPPFPGSLGHCRVKSSQRQRAGLQTDWSSGLWLREADVPQLWGVWVQKSLTVRELAPAEHSSCLAAGGHGAGAGRPGGHASLEACLHPVSGPPS